MTRGIVIAAAMAALLAGIAPVTAQQTAGSDVTLCQSEEAKPAERMAACSRVIDDAARTPAARADALMVRGALHEAASALDKAIADHTQAIALAPSAAAFLLRGNAYDAKGDAAKAIADYTQAIALDPADAASYFNRGAVHQEKGDTAAAAADYRKALAIDPKYDAARQGLREIEGK